MSEAQNERIFQAEILPDYLPNDIGKARQPALIVLGGQPGSGKTMLLTASHRELEQSGPTIRIAGDDLRSYHPGFLAHQRAHSATASRFAEADAGIWTEKLFAAAAERGVHIVFETTTRTPNSAVRIMMEGRAAGYRIEARVLAVSSRVSWQGCNYRFEEMQHAGAAARIPPRAVHDASVSGLAESLERIERRRIADRVLVYNSDGESVYDNILANGRWRSQAAARQTLEKTRNLPMSREQIQRFADIWASVIDRMETRGAPTALIDDARRQSGQDLAWFLAERRRSDAVGGTREQNHRIGGDRMPKIPSDPLAPTQGSPGQNSSAERSERRGRPGAVLVPARELPDLTDAEIGSGLGESSRLAKKRAEIERLSVLVYGNAAALSATIEGIDGAKAGAVAGQDVRVGKLGPMAGEGRGFLRAESPERQTARAHAPQLAAAMEDYGRTVDFERHRMEARHREEQYRQRQEIRAPSEGLTTVLRAPIPERAGRLNAAPELRRELDKIMASIHRRMTPDDRRAIRASDTDHIVRALHTTHDRALALVRLYQQTQDLGPQLRQRNRNVTLTIKR